jgi:HK97 family phage prohead protease
MSELRFAVAPIVQIEVRDSTGNGDNTWTMSGYAAVFNETTTLLDSKFGRLTESINPNAFTRVLAEQGLDTPAGVVHFNFGHDMNRAIAASDVPANQPGSLRLEARDKGLYFRAKVARDDPDGIALASKMRAGVVKQASFAFTVQNAAYTTIESEDGPDTEHREILELAHLYDVCATPQGAYSSTVANLRSYASALGQPTDVGATAVSPDFGGSITVSQDRGGVAHEPPERSVLIAGMEVLEEIRSRTIYGGALR